MESGEKAATCSIEHIAASKAAQKVKGDMTDMPIRGSKSDLGVCLGKMRNLHQLLAVRFPSPLIAKTCASRCRCRSRALTPNTCGGFFSALDPKQTDTNGMMFIDIEGTVQSVTVWERVLESELLLLE